MKLVRASYRPYGLPLKRAWSTSSGFANTRAGFLLELRDEGGHHALGDVSPLPGPGGTGLPAAARQLDRLVGLINEKTPDATLETPLADGLDDIVRHALSQAVLTLEALDRNLPLFEVLREWVPEGPAPAASVPVNAALPRAPLDETVEMAESAIERGFRCLKIKVGASVHEIERVAAVRAAVGPDVTLRLDANGGWTELEALYLLQRFEPFDIEYVEQPIPPGRVQTMHDLRQRSRIPFAADESARNLAQAVALIQRKAVDVIIVKPPALGGLDRAARLLARANEMKAKVVVTDSVDTAIGRTGALHLASLLGKAAPPCGLGSGEWLEWDVIAHPAEPKNGRLVVPTDSGLGIDTRTLEEVG